MCRKVIWSPRAQEAYISTLEYWIEHNGSSTYSNNIIDEVERIEQRILDFPMVYPIVYQTPEKEIRRALVLYNFSLFYQIFTDRIEIVFFFDNRNDPKKLLF